jgi:sulfur carrier protein
LDELAYDGKVATALNEEFVPASHRDKTALNTGDRVEILAPMQGG